MEDGDDPTQRALDLLSGAHTFPGPFELRVVVVPPSRDAVVDAVRAHVGDAAVTAVTERPSRNGTYLAVHIHTQVDRPETVLELYAILRTVEGVVTVL